MWSCIPLPEDVKFFQTNHFIPLVKKSSSVETETLPDSELACIIDCSVTEDMDFGISELNDREQDDCNSKTQSVAI